MFSEILFPQLMLKDRRTSAVYWTLFVFNVAPSLGVVYEFLTTVFSFIICNSAMTEAVGVKVPLVCVSVQTI